jgi:thiol-disulfide isomerase/thioredoxin
MVMRGPVSLLGAIVLASATVMTAAQAPATPSLVSTVRAALAKHDFAGAEALVGQYRSTQGLNSEALEAMSWLARGALTAKQLDVAERYAVDTQDEAEQLSKTVSLNTDRHLEIALGAALEVRALVKAERGARSEAVYLLQRALDVYGNTRIQKRIQKNINALSLQGQQALALDTAEHLGPPVPTLDAFKGKVVLMFFWAHWCPDCKAQAPIIAKLLDEHRALGFRVVAPTQRYGYITSGKAAAPDEELQHIVAVRDKFYAFLRDEPVPLSEVNHKRYGVSTTPTLVLLDRQGIVRVYHPGRMTEEELQAAIRTLL